MHQWRLPELQGVSTQPGDLTQRNSQARICWSSRFRRGSVRLRLCPTRGAPLWTWLLLGLLVVPGAWSFLSEEQEELLVELHNHYRGQVSPSASAMLPLRWDPNLKLMAEVYAAKCVWNHNPEVEDTGENLFAGTGPLDLREVLEKWFLEHLDYDFNNNSCDEDKMCGHYTQMVWADTHRVGCAFHLCSNMEGLDWDRVSFLVCNYYPAGNYEGERPFVEGDWCSRCPDNLQTCENNLCVPYQDDGEVDESDENEEGTVIPPAATSDPSLHSAEEEEEEVVPPAATNDPYIQPITTTTSAPKITTKFTRFTQPPATPDPGTPPPEVNPPKIKEEEEEEEEEPNKTQDGIKKTINQKKKIMVSSASASSPSALMASLMAVLALRL